MDACWSCIQDKVFNGWDWHLDIYKILYQHANCEKEYDEILEKLESDTNLKEGYMYSEMMMLKKDLLTEYKGAEAGKQFALQHLQIEKFRRQAIQDAMQDSDYQRAYQLCEEGIIQDKEYQGLVTQWNQWKLEIARKEGNKQMVKEVTCYLLLNENHLKEEYYKLLKEVIPTEQWPAFIVQLSEWHFLHMVVYIQISVPKRDGLKNCTLTCKRIRTFPPLSSMNPPFCLPIGKNLLTAISSTQSE